MENFNPQENKNFDRASGLHMDLAWGKVFRKIRFAYFLISWRDFGGEGNKKKIQNY